MIICHLEDTVFSTEKVKEKVEAAIPGARVISFEDWLELETWWGAKPKTEPDAVILDLLVPTKYKTFAHLLLGQPEKPFFKKWRYRFAKLIVVPIAYFWGPRYLKELYKSLGKVTGGVVEGRNTLWGGVEFLRSRIIAGDQAKVLFYTYSLAENKELIKYDKLFGEICKTIRGYVDIFTKNYQLRISRFSKGFKPGRFGTGDHQFIGDELHELIEQLKKDLSTPSATIDEQHSGEKSPAVAIPADANAKGPKLESSSDVASPAGSPAGVPSPPEVEIPAKAKNQLESSWPDREKLRLSVIGLVSNIILGILAYNAPQLTILWRILALSVLLALFYCLFCHAWFLVRYSSTAIKIAIPPITAHENLKPRGETLGADIEHHPGVTFVKFMFVALIVFSSFVTTLSVPDYLVLSPTMENGKSKLAPSSNPQIRNLMVNTTESFRVSNVVKLFGGAFYFCSVTFATVGYGDVSPGENAFWGRLSAVLMTLFLFIALPLFGKYILNASIVDAGQDLSVVPVSQSTT